MTNVIIFDLDNTLAPTNSLEQVRSGKMRWKDIPNETLEKIRPYPKVPLLIQKLAELGIKLGIVTNSPRRYCIPLLEHLGLKGYFKSIVAYDDVGGAIKPRPDGILKSLTDLGVHPHPKHLYFGDDLNDVAAAYRAGITPVLGSWGSRNPVNTTPALVMSSKEVIEYCNNPEKFQLVAELYANNSAAKVTPPPAISDLFFLGLNLDGHCVTLRNEVAVFALGRYFSQKSNTTACLHDAHNLSRHIEQKSHTGVFNIPLYWVDLFSNLIPTLAKNLVTVDIVTIIPSKPADTDKRMERLLDQVEASYRHLNLGSSVQFIKNALWFRPGARKMKTLGYEERQQEVNASLHLNQDINVTGKAVLVIDDVTTSLATIRRAHDLLTKAGARSVLGTVLAKTVSIQEDHVACPNCGRLMRFLKNKRDGSRFWSCSGFFEVDEHGNRACKKTLNI